MPVRRTALALGGAFLILILFVGLIWQFDRMRTASQGKSCLARGGTWDTVARACLPGGGGS